MEFELPDSWLESLRSELEKDYVSSLREYVESERREHIVFPPSDEVFTAFRLTPLDRVRVVIIGQDPYHDVGQAQGLCFSVRRGLKLPPSLVNIFKELRDDLGCEIPANGELHGWAEQGVLLTNTVLTVRAHEAHSHRKQGWELFTDRVIEVINAERDFVVFVLWGKPAQQKMQLIDHGKHAIVQSAHPSPLSARRGFIGSRPFSKVNHELVSRGFEPIDWSRTSSTTA